MINLKNLLLLLFLGSFTPIFAQKPMVAYRKEGVWHFFNTIGKPMWEAYADKAGNPSGWVNGLLRGDEMDIVSTDLANFSAARRQVLYNPKGEIVFAPKLPFRYRIVRGFDRAHFIQLQNMDDDRLFLLDSLGDIKYASKNSGSIYLGDGVVAMLKNDAELEAEGDKNYALLEVKTQKVLANIKCRGFLGDFKNGAICCFNAGFQCGILTRQGKLGQPMIYSSGRLEDFEADIFKTGFIFLKKEDVETGALFNKKGEVVLENVIQEIWLKNNFFQAEMKLASGNQTNTYALAGGKIEPVDDLFFPSSEPTEGGFIACQDIDYLTFLLDRNLKTVAKIEQSSDIKVLAHHFWIRPSFKTDFVCFDETGNQTGVIFAEEIGKPAHNHVFFRQKDLWGLAHENGKIIVKPTFTFPKDADNQFILPEIMDDFWGVSVKLSEESYRFEYYNFSGALVFPTESEKDGWDFLIEQLQYPDFYSNY